MFAELFQRKYLESLDVHKSFYDDLDEYGNSHDPDEAIYFVPGFNGTPAQIRFAFPSILQKFGKNIYIKCFYLPEFSAKTPTWEKYTFANVQKKVDKVAADLEMMLSRFARIKVVASSTGFYELRSALLRSGLDKEKERIEIIWVACAPDTFQPSSWEDFFYRFNGFTLNQNKWWCFPNHNALKFMNPETDSHFNWQVNGNKKTYYKIDLESRFPVFGIYWGYISIDCTRKMYEALTAETSPPITIPSYILCAENDGFWQGKTKDEIVALLDKYLANKHVLFKRTSHLWVTQPDYIAEIASHMQPQRLNDAPKKVQGIRQA